ncbi:hypothetical protein L9F63_018179, partial [Diploptera punctata]
LLSSTYFSVYVLTLIFTRLVTKAEFYNVLSTIFYLRSEYFSICCIFSIFNEIMFCVLLEYKVQVFLPSNSTTASLIVTFTFLDLINAHLSLFFLILFLCDINFILYLMLFFIAFSNISFLLSFSG